MFEFCRADKKLPEKFYNEIVEKGSVSDIKEFGNMIYESIRMEGRKPKHQIRDYKKIIILDMMGYYEFISNGNDTNLEFQLVAVLNDPFGDVEMVGDLEKQLAIADSPEFKETRQPFLVVSHVSFEKDVGRLRQKYAPR